MATKKCSKCGVRQSQSSLGLCRFCARSDQHRTLIAVCEGCGTEVQMTADAKRAKYGNTAVLVTFTAAGETVSGHLRLAHRFDSAKEAAHYQELALRRRAREITNLVLQEPLPLIVRKPNGEPEIVGELYLDFVYDDLKDGKRHYVDVKSEGTKGIAVFRLKKKIIEVCHAIVIEER